MFPFKFAYYATHKGPIAASWVGVGGSPTPSPLALSLQGSIVHWLPRVSRLF